MTSAGAKVVASFTVHTPAKTDVAGRVRAIGRQVKMWTEGTTVFRSAEPLDAIAVEEIQHGRGEGVAVSGPLLFMVKGAIIRVADEVGIPILFYRSQEWRASLGLKSIARGKSASARYHEAQREVKASLPFFLQGTETLRNKEERAAAGVAYHGASVRVLEERRRG